MSVYGEQVRRIANCISGNFPSLLKPGCNTADLVCEIIERCARLDGLKATIDGGLRDSSMINMLGHVFPHGIKSAKIGKTFFKKRPTITIVGRTEKERIDDLTRYDLRDAMIELMDTFTGETK